MHIHIYTLHRYIIYINKYIYINITYIYLPPVVRTIARCGQGVSRGAEDAVSHGRSTKSNTQCHEHLDLCSYCHLLSYCCYDYRLVFVTKIRIHGVRIHYLYP